MLSKLSEIPRRPVVVSSVLLATAVAALTLFSWGPLSTRGEGSPSEPGTYPLTTIPSTQLARHNLELTAANPSQIADVAWDREQIRAVAEAGGVPLREDPQLVLFGEPHPQVPATAGPVWAVVPDRPAAFTEGPVPRDGETWVVMFLDPETG